MSQREYRIGPGAASLMLLVVVLSMCVLGVLALMGARSDRRAEPAQHSGRAGGCPPECSGGTLACRFGRKAQDRVGNGGG